MKIVSIIVIQHSERYFPLFLANRWTIIILDAKHLFVHSSRRSVVVTWRRSAVGLGVISSLLTKGHCPPAVSNVDT